MASLVIFMQLRYLFHEVQRRIRRHKNYLRVINNMEARWLYIVFFPFFPFMALCCFFEFIIICLIYWFLMKALYFSLIITCFIIVCVYCALYLCRFAVATAEELAANDDDCAICWDTMLTARKLPCGHLFHKYSVFFFFQSAVVACMHSTVHASIVLLVPLTCGSIT